MPKSSLYLVMKNVPAERWSYLLNQKSVVLGNSPDPATCQVWIPNVFGWVSGAHAEITRDRTGHRLRDLDSDGGTAINGAWITGSKRGELQFGDTIWIGGVELEVVKRVDRLARVVPTQDHWPSGPRPEDAALRCNRLRCASLTQGELHIVLGVSRGIVHVKQIATAQSCATSTVPVHLRSIYRKLGVRSLQQLNDWLEHSTKSGGGKRRRPADRGSFEIRSLPGNRPWGRLPACLPVNSVVPKMTCGCPRRKSVGRFMIPPNQTACSYQCANPSA